MKQSNNEVIDQYSSIIFMVVFLFSLNKKDSATTVGMQTRIYADIQQVDGRFLWRKILEYILFKIISESESESALSGTPPIDRPASADFRFRNKEARCVLERCSSATWPLLGRLWVNIEHAKEKSRLNQSSYGNQTLKKNDGHVLNCQPDCGQFTERLARPVDYDKRTTISEWKIK